MNQQTPTRDVDAATTEIIRRHLIATAREMERSLIRTSYNAIIYEVKDFAISVYDDAYRLLADSSGNNLFLGANDYGIRKSVEHVGVENIEPDDVILTTYPYWSSRHPQDALLFSPAIYEGEIIGYPVVRAHWLDLGQKDPGYVFDSIDVHQEGLLIPAMKVFKRGNPDEEILDLIRFNSRSPTKVIGDLNAQVSAVETGKRRYEELFEKYGAEAVRCGIQKIIDHGEAKAREVVCSLPDGEWVAEDYLDSDGVNDELVPLRARVSIYGDEVTIDLSESSDAVDGPFNVPIGLTQSVCKLCFKAITTPSESSNAGHHEPLSIVAPEGNLFNAQYPAPTYSLGTSIVALEVIFKAFAQGIPAVVPASSGGDICNMGVYGIDPGTGEMFVEATNEAVGLGATDTHDGENALMHLSEATQRNLPVEVWETNAPIRIDRLELRTDSGGAGQYRGGLGVRRDYVVLDDISAKSFIIKTRTDGWGLEGGQPGAKNAIVLRPDRSDDGWRDRFGINVDNSDLYPGDDHLYVGMFRGDFIAGETISNRSGGGGGYGDPFDRDPSAVLEDVSHGYVSRESARREYGVAVTDDLELDVAITEELREARD